LKQYLKNGSIIFYLANEISNSPSLIIGVQKIIDYKFDMKNFGGEG